MYQETDTFGNAIFHVQQSDISHRRESELVYYFDEFNYRRHGNIQENKPYSGIVTVRRGHFHFRLKDVHSPACQGNYNSFNPLLAGTFITMQTQPESSKSRVTLHRVTGSVTSFLVSHFVRFNDVRPGHCNRMAKQTLA